MSSFSLNRFFVLLLALVASAATLRAQQFRSEIQSYLQQAKPKWKLTDQDATNWVVSDQYANKQSGTTYTYIQQQISGIRIYNAVSTMVVRKGKVAHYANRFYSDAASKANDSTPGLTPANAVQAAAAHLGLTLLDQPALQKQEENRRRWTFGSGGISKRPIQVELLYVPVENTFRLAWNVVISPKNSPDSWNVRIDAHSGDFIEKNNWTISCDFGSHAYTGGRTLAGMKPGQTVQPQSAAGALYNIFPLPVEAPSFGARSVVADPGSLLASPFGWHDVDGADGAEYTITRGNNVYAYEDRADQDTAGYSPDGGLDLKFDFPLDFTQQPLVNQDAVITNLFYVNNMVHDILYHHGFDAAAGNFQANNYGDGGLENDYVLAEAQDGGGTNNANFAPYPDGENGRMQMYLWGNTEPATLTVNTPAAIAGNYVAVEAGFGPGFAAPITSDIVLAADDTAPTSDGCQSFVNEAEISGKIAVVDRGTCNFAIKVANAEAAGAIAVIVCNNQPGAPFSMGGNGQEVNIPSMMISQADGNALKAQLSAGNPVNVTLVPAPPSVDLDGSLDNGIVTHEYGHGLSVRLTGGPDNSNCLDNGEQGGEGWSDWLALLLTMQPGDAGADARPMGTYAFSEATNGGGIRRYPYSTDMAVNPQTYADLASSNEVHDIGEIWCQVLWDMTWKLIDAEGFDPDWFNGAGGNNTAMNLVIEAMKIQPCGPGYLDARDAILIADELLYDNAHRCLIWEAFARRGMGYDAKQGSADITGDETPGFALPPICQTVIVPPTAGAAVDAATSCFGTFHFPDKSTNVPQMWQWYFGDGGSSTDINPSHTYATPGTYSVVLLVTNILGADADTLVVTYAPLEAPAISGNTVVCAGHSALLAANVANGNTAIWSLDGNLVYTGATFISPSLSATTTYSVVQEEVKPVQHVGPLSNTFGNGGNHNNVFTGKLLFEAFAPFRLLSVLVYAQGAGDRTIELYDADDNIIQSLVVNVPAGSSRVTLNLDIPSAGLYSIGSKNLYRNNAGASYPYEIAGLVRIYSSNSTNSPLTYYYYFYDWEVQETGCSGAPTEVTVAVVPEPQAAFSAATNNLNATFTDNSGGAPISWSWNFGDGSPASALQNPTHTYAASGTYTVTLTVTNDGCSNMYQQIITVTDGSSGLSEAPDAFGMRLFPNPASDRVYIAFERAPAGPATLIVTGSDGRVLLSQNMEHPGNEIMLETATLPAGAYKVRIAGKEGSAVRKLFLVK